MRLYCGLATCIDSLFHQKLLHFGFTRFSVDIMFSFQIRGYWNVSWIPTGHVSCSHCIHKAFSEVNPFINIIITSLFSFIVIRSCNCMAVKYKCVKMDAYLNFLRQQHNCRSSRLGFSYGWHAKSFILGSRQALHDHTYYNWEQQSHDTH